MTTPEQGLWQAVLLRAIEDAIEGVKNHDKRSQMGLKADTRAAQLWLTKPSEDLSIVCHNAGLDAVAVREAIARQIADPRPAPAKVKPSVMQLTHAGETMTISQWADRTGLTAGTITARIQTLHWSVERALTAPVDRRKLGKRRPGVVSNLVMALGTGGGPTAQETPNLQFSSEDAA